MDAQRKTLMAIGLMALWGGVAYWQWGMLPESVHVPLVNISGAVLPVSRSAPQSVGLRVHLEQLASAPTQREGTFTAPRNIFALPGPDGTVSVTSEAAGGAPDQVSEQALLQQAAALELAQYRYLGFVRMGESVKSAGNTAVLSKNEDVLIGRAGQHIDRHLVVKTVTPESVTLRDIQAHIDHTVPLTEDAVVPQP